MINVLPNNQCKMMNIVWVERGILLTLIYIIIKKHDYLKKKKIIIDNNKYINLLQFFFPKLKFGKFKKHKSKNFYFNIRNIIRKQDIIIDYVNNYDKIINTKKITLIPWFDMNDVLISYKFDENEELNINKYTNFIKNFSYYKRCNYNNTLWDVYVENYVFKKYGKLNDYINVEIFINYFNNFIKSNYTNTIVEVPKIYYVEKLVTQPLQTITQPLQTITQPVFNNDNISMFSKDNKYQCEINQELFNKITKSAFYNKLYDVTKNKYNFNIIKKKIDSLEKQIYIYGYLNSKIHNVKLEQTINNLSTELKKLVDIKNSENLNYLLNELKNFYK